MAGEISASTEEAGGLIYQGTYAEYKTALDTEIRKTAEGFVRVGYLLKIARDTEILHESGYGSVAEFAQVEYGLTKDVVSRYIAINDKYSEGGYSETLQERFRGYGVAKLAEMLTLPDSVIEAMDPQLTKAQIREVKEEVRAEMEITPVEVMLEPQEAIQRDKTALQQFLHQYFHDHPDKFCRMHPFTLTESIEHDQGWIEKTLDIMCPAGNGCESVRIPGRGRLLLFFRGRDRDMDLVDVRADERQAVVWNKLREEVMRMCCRHENPKKAWEAIYEAAFPEESKPEPAKVESVAPVNETKPEPRKEEKKNPIDKLKSALKKAAGKEKVAPAQPEPKEQQETKPERETVEEVQEEIMNPPEVIREEDMEIEGSSFWEKRMEIKKEILVLQDQFIKGDWAGMARTADLIMRNAESLKEN